MSTEIKARATKKYSLIIFDWYGTLMDNGVLFAGVPELLATLKDKGYTLAIASSMTLGAIKKLLEKNQIATYFSHLQTQDLGYPKPDPGMLEAVLSATNFTAGQALMVGDSAADFYMALMAKVDCIGIADSSFNGEDYQLKAVLTNVTQLLDFLL